MSLPRFESTPHFPASAVKGLTLVGAFQLSQRDEIIEKQQAKRRGGPKKAKLIFSVSDQRQTDSEKLSTCELDWKTISQKNFSNRLNIQQYQRNPFALARMGSGDMSLVVIIHGAVKNDGVVTNATGVNMDGKDLALHPRFLLSSGKGDEGAKSTFLVYAVKNYLSIQIEKVWIEHRELKVNIEGINSVQQVRAPSIQHMADIPYVQFAKKFKIVYESKAIDHVQHDAVAATSSSSAGAKLKKSGKRASWVSASELAAQMKQTSASSVAAPSFASSSSSSSPSYSSASSHLKRSHDNMLHSPPHMSNEEYEYAEKEEEDVKKRMMFAQAHDELAAANFTGFEEGYNPISSPDELPSFTFNDLSANGISDDAMMEDDGDSTPLSDASDALTPLRASTPSPATSSSSSDSDFLSQMEEAEDSLDQFDPSRVYRLKAASQQMSSMLPEPLRHATASGAQFSVVFQPYQGSPLAQPMSLDLSPIMSAQANFLPSLSMSPYTMSPPPLFDLDCKKQSSPAAAASAQPSASAAASSTTPPLQSNSA